MSAVKGNGTPSATSHMWTLDSLAKLIYEAACIRNMRSIRNNKEITVATHE